MGFDSLVRSGVALANTLTTSLQTTVEHSAWTASDGRGAPVFASSVSRPALVEYKQKAVRTSTGETVLSTSKVTILGPVEETSATGREGPIDPRDKIVLSDGTTGPIVAVNGLLDPLTNQPYMYEVYIG